jgi:hypothetical protein
MRHLVMFLVSSEDESTDTVQAFAEDVAHLYGPPYVGILDYSVRVDVPSCFVLDGSNAAKEAVDEILDLIEPDPWGNEADAMRDEFRGEPGSLMDREGIAYNRESYF